MFINHVSLKPRHKHDCGLVPDWTGGKSWWCGPGKAESEGQARKKTWASNDLKATEHLGDVSSLRVEAKMAEMKSYKQMFGFCWNEVFSTNFACTWSFCIFLAGELLLVTMSCLLCVLSLP